MPYDDYQIPTRPMTADDVFAVIIDLTRHAAVGPSATDEINSLNFDTPVGEWELCFVDGIDRANAAAGLNELFGTVIPEAEWQRVLEPTQTLADVCALVARRAVMPVIEPLTVMGEESRAAGAFLAVRRILRDAGVDVAELRPSSLIGPYLKQKLDPVIPRLRRLAPGTLPPADVVAPAHFTVGL